MAFLKSFLSLVTLLMITIIPLIASTYSEVFGTFPACQMGRLQSPIKLNVTNSVYNSDFSIVYQQFEKVTYNFPSSYNASKDGPYSSGSIEGGFINFQKDGVIKQYKLIRFEIYPGMHKVGSVRPKTDDLELHIVFEKNLGFTSNKNQYRRIADTNNYLVYVLRYQQNSNQGSFLQDGGLLEKVVSKTVNLGDYPVFQDKRAYFYQGSFMYSPCNEDVNYVVIDQWYSLIGTSPFNGLNDIPKKALADDFSRPIYRNFMNYTETMSGSRISINIFLFAVMVPLLF